MKKVLKIIGVASILAIPIVGAADAASWFGSYYGPGPATWGYGIGINTIGLVTTGGSNYYGNPDRRRIAGAALIMKSMGLINDPSIPSNVITKQTMLPPQNTITTSQYGFYNVGLDKNIGFNGLDYPPMVKYQINENGKPYLIK